MARGGKSASASRSKTNKSKSSPTSTRTLILDNGAHTIKAGFAPPLSEDNDDGSSNLTSLSECHLIPNCIARSQRDRITYIGAELDSCADFGELAIRRPVERGYVVNWEGEKAIWEKSFGMAGSSGGPETAGEAAAMAAAVVACEPAETNLIVTEAPNAPVVFQRNMDEMVFEEFGFASAARLVAPVLNAYAPSPFPNGPQTAAGVPHECLLVVDVGHSHTTVTPLYQGRPLQGACRRLEIGGKTLTNALKESLSRTVEVQREDWIVQEIKEDVCYVSQAFAPELERVWKGGLKDPREVDTSIVVDYVLPDYEDIKRGFARPHDPYISRKDRALGVDGGRREHIIVIGNERFTVPELLFTPSDIGMQQEGIAGTILQSIYSLPQSLWQAFLANILIVGGSSKFPGFKERLEAELRSHVSDEYLVRLAQPEDPLKNVWLGGARIAQSPDVLKRMTVTRAEYMEKGDLWTRRKFAGRAV